MLRHTETSALVSALEGNLITPNSIALFHQGVTEEIIRWKEGIVPLCSALGRPHLQSWGSSGCQDVRKTQTLTEHPKEGHKDGERLVAPRFFRGAKQFSPTEEGEFPDRHLHLVPNSAASIMCCRFIKLYLNSLLMVFLL